MDDKLYREKVLGCWIGKAVGGTLGMPYEGLPGTHALVFYEPVPTEPVPNDDLDLQVLWACLLDKSPVIERRLFEDGWRFHVGFPWDEYGVAIRNLKLGIRSPWSGRFDNCFTNGMGAAIRSELWACLAPGDPVRAADYARVDAEADHDGDGLHAARFLAALQSAAFAGGRTAGLVDGALAVLPADTRLARALADTRAFCRDAGRADWLAVREKILAKWEHENFTDVVQNLCFISMTLLLGDGDFDWSVCAAANCGKDTDCTAATVGATLGILDPAGIDARWLAPISRKLVVDARITGIDAPATLDDFTDLVVALRGKVAYRPEPEPAFDPAPYAIRARRVFLPDYSLAAAAVPPPPVFPDAAGTVVFAGQRGTMAARDIPPGGAAALRFVFTLARDGDVRVVFNTRQPCAVWLDDAARPSFMRAAGGDFVPSPHRAPADQFVDCRLSAGEHTLTAVLVPGGDETELEWLITVAAAEDMQWLPVFFPGQTTAHRSNSDEIQERV